MTKERGVLVNGQRQLTIPAPRPVKRVNAEQHAKAKTAMQDLLRDRYVRSFFGMPSTDELIDGNNYVIGSDGLYMVRKNKIGLFTTRIAETEKTTKIPLVENGKQPVEGFTMALERKIPHQFLLQTVAFFKKVLREKAGAEAVVQIFYNEEEKEYFFHIADQGVSGGAARMDRNAELEAQHVLVADIHSHNHMGAFFSGTDNRDEKEARIYGVMGKVGTPWPDMQFRAGDGNGGWIQLHAFDVFETPDVEVEIPEEWMTRVHSHADYAKYSKYKEPVHHVDPRERIVERYTPGKRTYERRHGVFGRAGSTNQDEYAWPIEDWANEIGWEGEDFSQYLHSGDIGLAIESLVESAEVLNVDEAKGMWLSLFEKLNPEAKEILKQAAHEA